MIKFLLLANSFGQLRLSRYFKHIEKEVRAKLETEVIRNCITRSDNQCSFVEYQDIKLVYRRYGSLYFIVGIDEDENELAVYEFIQCLVEVLNEYFEKVSEIDLMFNLEKVHLILDEMIANGNIIDANRKRILTPLRLLEQAKK